MTHMLMYNRIFWNLCQLWPDLGRINTSFGWTTEHSLFVILQTRKMFNIYWYFISVSLKQMLLLSKPLEDWQLVKPASIGSDEIIIASSRCSSGHKTYSCCYEMKSNKLKHLLISYFYFYFSWSHIFLHILGCFLILGSILLTFWLMHCIFYIVKKYMITLDVRL